MEKELNRYRCAADDGCHVDVIEYQHVQTIKTIKRSRTYPGARRLVTAGGDAVRYIDSDSFEIIDTGEFLRRQD